MKSPFGFNICRPTTPSQTTSDSLCFGTEANISLTARRFNFFP